MEKFGNKENKDYIENERMNEMKNDFSKSVWFI